MSLSVKSGLTAVRAVLQLPQPSGLIPQGGMLLTQGTAVKHFLDAFLSCDLRGPDFLMAQGQPWSLIQKTVKACCSFTVKIVTQAVAQTLKIAAAVRTWTLKAALLMIRFRRGSIVHRKKLAEMPTGFLGDQEGPQGNDVASVV